MAVRDRLLDRGAVNMVESNLGPQMNAVVSLEATLWSALSASVLVAIFVLVAAEFLRPLLRQMVQIIAVRRWRGDPSKAVGFEFPHWLENRKLVPDELRSRARLAQEEGASAPKRQFGWNLRLGSLLPNELFMRKVQSEAQLVLQDPSHMLPQFAFLARKPLPQDRGAVLAVEWLKASDDDRLRVAMKEGREAATGFAAIYAQVEHNVAQAVERKLDELQLRLVTWWAFTLRVMLPVLGLAVAQAAARVGADEYRSGAAILVIGLLGGLLAGWLQAIIGSVISRRQD